MIPLLAPLFQGDWAAYGEALACAPDWPAGTVPVSRLAGDDPLLDEALGRYAAHLGVAGDDLRAVASAWSQEYLWALLPPVAAAASVLQHRFPVHAADMAVSLGATGAPVRFHIGDEGQPMPGSQTDARYGVLLENHLAPLFQAIVRQTRIAPKILWGNAARYLDSIFEQALALTGNAAHVAADRKALLQQPAHPDGRPNPLYGRQRTVVRIDNGFPAPLTLHRQCCLFYRLPGQGYCGACPLAPEHQRAAG